MVEQELEYMVRSEPKRLIRNIILNTDVLNEEQAEAKASAFKENRRLARRLTRQLMAEGYVRTEAEAEYWVNEWVSIARDDQPSRRSRAFLAAVRPATDLVMGYVRDRTSRHGGDSAMTIEIRGRTGSGKSGMALALAEVLGLQAHQARDAVHFEARPFITALKRNIQYRAQNAIWTPAQIMDESNLPVGEGSDTTQQVLRNEEGRLREGGVSQIYCRPNVTDDMLRDLTLEMVGVSERSRTYLALAFVQGQPLGFIQLPWPSSELWASYQPCKKEALTSRNTPEIENLRRELLEILANKAIMERLNADQGDDAMAEYEVQRNLLAGVSVNTVRRIVQLVKRGAALYDDEPAYVEYVLRFLRDDRLPYGLSKETKEQLLAWATGTTTNN